MGAKSKKDTTKARVKSTPVAGKAAVAKARGRPRAKTGNAASSAVRPKAKTTARTNANTKARTTAKSKLGPKPISKGKTMTAAAPVPRRGTGPAAPRRPARGAAPDRLLAEALEQQAATSEILRVISRSQYDVQPVFETIAASALRLCDAVFSAVMRFDGELIHIGALRNLDRKRAAAFEAAYPCRPNRGGATQRAILTGRRVHIPDIAADPEYTYHHVASKAHFRSVLSVPMLHDGASIGTITVYRDIAQPFPKSQVELLETFADQAVIAIENVRLFTELGERNRALTEALEQQTATSEVLRVISGSPTDTQPVFELLAQRAGKLCDAEVAVVSRFDGGMIELAAVDGVREEAVAIVRGLYPMSVNMGSVTARAIRECAVVHTADVLADRDYEIKDFAVAAHYRSGLGVPIVRDRKVIGSIFVGRSRPGLFSDAQVELLKTFADQAVIAIENVRLFTELESRNRAVTEALEQQTATSDILRVISQSPTDVQPVFDTIAAAAHKLCQAASTNVFTYDGQLVHLASCVNANPDYVRTLHQFFPRPVSRDAAVLRAIASRRIVAIPDVHADADYSIRTPDTTGGFRSVLAVPLLREGRAVGGIAVGRAEPGPFSDAQIALLETFAAQAVIAIQNVRLFTELGSRNSALTEALEQQTATSDILRVISGSPTDVQPVFDTIAASVLKLCRANAANVFTFDGTRVHLASLVNKLPGYEEKLAPLFPRPPDRGAVASRAILECKVVAVPDVQDDPDYSMRDLSTAGGFRSALGVPLVRDGQPIGSIAVGRAEPGPFSDAEIALLQTFAAQAVIAIENVRLFRELEERNRNLIETLEQQTATSEILRVISGSPTDVQPVFDSIAAAARILCGATSADVLMVDGDQLMLAALVTVVPGAEATLRAAYPRPIRGDVAPCRAVLTRRAVEIPDVMEDPEFSIPGIVSAAGFRSALAVPLLRDGIAIGAIAVGRADPGRFPETQVALLQTFADQAVIAIENVRLFNELDERNRNLTESLDQQTATSEILRVISQSQKDVQPVFDTIQAAAQRLCRAEAANLYTFDGELVHVGSFVNTNPELAESLRRYFPRPPGRETAVLRAILTRSVVAIPDVLEDEDYAIGAPAAAGGFRSVMAVPLIREGSAIGGIAVGRLAPGPFPEEQIALLQTFADQAVIAIENVRLFRELEGKTTELGRSVSELEALGEIGQAVSSTLDLETVLSTIVTRATELAGMNGGAIYEYDEAAELFHLHTTFSLGAELVDALRVAPIRKGEGALGGMAVTGKPNQVPDVADERAYKSRLRSLLIQHGCRSLLAVPLLREHRLLGGLVVYRNLPGDFDPQVIALMQTFATQSALAIQNARLFREIEETGRQLKTASQHKSEFLANMSHELRTPLNAILGFSEVLTEQIFGEVNAKQAEYLNDILESGRHLLSLINDILDLSKIEAGRMELEPEEFDLPGAIENALMLVRERAHRRNIALDAAIDPGVGTIRADQRKVKQVVLNLLSNALKFTPEGGKVGVRARAYDGVAEVSVHDTGVGIAPEDQEAVFEEFRQVGSTAKKIEGTGLGLAISRKFVELHGGKLWLASEVGKGSTFSFTLPLGK